ncbi:MAG: hypothetical protein WAW17_29305 [Rhodococcus sp. (in: high G+C Gram-positive bacteria)]|uniref:hypothetical protein n=1 Tax=Rhodococcus sp. TaxID=1831 RepID=UPI003BAFF018
MIVSSRSTTSPRPDSPIPLTNPAVSALPAVRADRIRLLGGLQTQAYSMENVAEGARVLRERLAATP